MVPAFLGCLAALSTPVSSTWKKQIARNLTDCDDFLLGQRYVLMDRDGNFRPTFREILKHGGAEPLLLPQRSLDLNAYVGRFMRTVKSECLSQMIFFCEKSLRRAVKEYIAHHDAERNHQGLDYKIIDPMHHMEVARTASPVASGWEDFLKYYYREAA